MQNMTTNATLKVLVVDDDQFQLEFISDMLRAQGVRSILTADSGKAALPLLSDADKQPDLLICDLHMPGMDGFQFMESVANLHYAGALMIISGQNSRVIYSASLVAQLRRFNFLGTIEKPVESDKLAIMLRALTEPVAGQAARTL